LVANDKLCAAINTKTYYINVNKYTIEDDMYIYKKYMHNLGHGDFTTNFHSNNPSVELYLIGNRVTEPNNKLRMTRDTRHLIISAIHAPPYIEIHSPVKLTELKIYCDSYYLCSKLRYDMCLGNTPETVLYRKIHNCIACIRTGSQLYVCEYNMAQL